MMRRAVSPSVRAVACRFGAPVCATIGSSPYHARLAATPLRPSFSGSCARPCGSERASGSIIDGPGQEGGDCGSTSPRSLDELAQLRTHTAHYSPVMIAPLSINSSHADCRPEHSFFSAHALVTETVPSSSRRALPGRKLQFTNPFIILSLRASERASGGLIDGPGQVGAIAG